ncbi:MAG: cell division ATPase MinD [Candidatus Diapherotrites archaeon]|nr:cell division ATPase MinD [Candidatus Diapherotrites archaeon]
MSRTIAIASGKGGVGKTTLTANVGIALAKSGFKVLLVDADIAMANLSLLLGMHSSPITLHDVLLGESNVEDAIYDGPGGVKFMPSGLSLESYRRVDSDRLQSVVKQVAGDYDFVLLDCPPGIERTVMASLAASDEALLITMPNPPSIADVLKTKLVAQRLGCNPIGVIINFSTGEKGEVKGEDIMKMLELPIYGVIPMDAEVRRSFMQENVQPLMLRKPDAPASVAMRKIAAKISGAKEAVIAKPARIGFLTRLKNIFKRGKK